jgi:MSHA biogenesis protein MshQ
MNMDVDGVGGNDHVQIGANTVLRFGRLRMENAVGSEALTLAVPIQTQYWNGAGFATNTLDGCTTLARSDVALDFNPPSNLTACKTAVNAASIPFTAGVGSLTLSAPGSGNNGSVLLTANLGTAAGSYCNPGTYVAATNSGRSYLLGRWNDASDPDANANTMYDDKPSARAAFGLYGSQPSNFIYLRENY